jgi:predicted lysophospholipase L1 biosynthesis ABC-type transport system permease subunit
MASDNECPTGARHDAQISDLVRWQTNQNGTLGKLASHLDDVDAKLDAKFERLYLWLMGCMLTALIAAGVGVLNLLSK